MIDEWSKNSWKQYPILHQPEWPDKDKFKSVIDKLSSLPAFVYADEQIFRNYVAKSC
jgi:3-deoxy-7-phosphoheptulonate synthase